MGIILLPKEYISVIRKDLLSQKNDAYESKTFFAGALNEGNKGITEELRTKNFAINEEILNGKLHFFCAVQKV